MAHPCANCGGECYCSGDIDDCIVSKTPGTCETCGCEDDYEPEEDFDDDIEDDPVGWECVGCLKGYDRPGDCPICGNPLEPYG